MDKFLIDIANRIDSLIDIIAQESISMSLDEILGDILNKIDSPWRYDVFTCSYILCSSEEWERREKEEMLIMKGCCTN